MRKNRFITASACACVTFAGALATPTQGQEVEVTGWAKVDYFFDIPGTAVDDLLNSDAFWTDQPSETMSVYGINLPENYADNYGTRTTGWVVVSESGQYDFFVSSDDASRLYLSSDENPPDPYFDLWIAEETGCCNAFLEPGADGTLVTQTTAEPISLTAGRRYAFMFLQKEGTGGDYGRVAMRKVDDPTPAADLTPIGGENLISMADISGISLEITTQPQNTQGVEGVTATLKVPAVVTSAPASQ